MAAHGIWLRSGTYAEKVIGLRLCRVIKLGLTNDIEYTNTDLIDAFKGLP